RPGRAGTGARRAAPARPRARARDGTQDARDRLRVGSARMEAKVREGHAPAVVIALEAGEQLVSEAGAMMFISGDVSMDVEMPGGLMGGLKRAVLAGESMFLARYTARGSGAVGICGPFPGSIREHELDGEIICEKHAYLAHHGEVAIESAFAKKLGMGIAGG